MIFSSSLIKSSAKRCAFKVVLVYFAKSCFIPICSQQQTHSSVSFPLKQRFQALSGNQLSDWDNSQDKQCQSYSITAVLKSQFRFILCFLLFCSLFFFKYHQRQINAQKSEQICYLFNCLFALDLLACFNNLSLSFINKGQIQMLHRKYSLPATPFASRNSLTLGYTHNLGVIAAERYN